MTDTTTPGTALAVVENNGWRDYGDQDVDPADFASEIEEARRQGEVLRTVARYSPNRSVRFELGWRGREWLAAADTLEQIGTDATIELLSGLQPGMRVPQTTNAEDEQWKRVQAVSKNGYMILVFDRGGYPKQVWDNVQGPSSPVVVRR